MSFCDNLTKTCNSCHQVKNISEFYIDRAAKDNLQGRCKECDRKRLKIVVKESYHKNIEVSRQKHRIWYSNNKELIKEYNKNVSIEAKERRRVLNNTYKTKRGKIDIVFKLRWGISKTICNALKRKEGSKYGKSILEYLPYTFLELKTHLEKQFTPEMNWQNHGKYWEIDHIYPQSKLPYDSMEHPNFQRCWALSNLQPLTKSDNLKKHNKISEEYNNLEIPVIK